MSKGTIQSYEGSGKYLVRLVPDNTLIDAQIVGLQTKITEIDPEITVAETAYDDAEAVVSTKADAVDSAILAYNSETPDAYETLTAAQTELVNAAWDRDKKKLEWEELKTTKLSHQERITYLESAKSNEAEDISCWCADYTEDLTGDVGLIDIDQKSDEDPHIQPGHGGNAVYACARDGKLHPPQNLTPSGAFIAWAVKPGWQKFRPTYRVSSGLHTINRTLHTCSVRVRDAISDVTPSIDPDLDLGPGDWYSNVPIDYMGTGSDAVSGGDFNNLLIEFTGQNPDTPKVIGFYQGPKQPEMFIKFKLDQEYVGFVDGSATRGYEIYISVRNATGSNLMTGTIGAGAVHSSSIEWLPGEQCFKISRIRGLHGSAGRTALDNGDKVFLFAENQDYYGVYDTQYPNIIKQSQWYQNGNGIIPNTDTVSTVSLPYTSKTADRQDLCQYHFEWEAYHNTYVSSRDWTARYIGIIRDVGAWDLGTSDPGMIDLAWTAPAWWYPNRAPVVNIMEGGGATTVISTIAGSLGTARGSTVNVNRGASMGPTGLGGVDETITVVQDMSGWPTVPLPRPFNCLALPVKERDYPVTTGGYYNNPAGGWYAMVAGANIVLDTE